MQQVKIIRRKVKYPRLELKTGLPILILPENGKFNPTVIIKKHEQWLKNKMKLIKALKDKYKKQKIYQRDERELISLLAKLSNEFSSILKIEPKAITFRYMKTKWASCSKKKRVCFNLMLKYLPTFLIRYVVFHEMTHLIIPNHSGNFWSYIKKRYKNPGRYEEMLAGYWFLLNDIKSKQREKN